MDGVFVAVGLLTGLWLVGCATSEETKQQSKGYYQEGMASLEHDRQKAYVSFQKAVQLDPDNKEARYGLGHILVYQGKLPQAESEFRAAIKIDGNYSEAHTYLGQVLAYQNRWPEAIAEFRRALSNPLYSTPDLARFHLGKALAHEGDYQGAMEALEDALAVNPPNVPPAMLQLELGRVLNRDDPLTVVDERRHGIEHGRLARTRTTGNEDVEACGNDRLQYFGNL